MGQRSAAVRLGVRAQILLGLSLVTLSAVLSTGYLVLWAGGASLRIQRESTAHALAVAAAAGAAAAIDPEQPLRAPTNRARLAAVGAELTRQGEVSQVSFIQPDRQIVVTQPPRLPGDRDPPLLLAVLGGVGPALHYRPALDGPDSELLAYAPMLVHDQVVGGARVSVPAPAPTTVVVRRSGWVLLSLALADALLVLGLAFLVLTQTVVRPLSAVQRATDRVATGDWDQVITPSGPREVAALATAFNQMTAGLVSQREQLIRTEKLASVGQLAAGVAHEIGNPLAAILGFVDILRADEQAAVAGVQHPPALAPADRRDMLDRVRAETQRIHRTIQDLLEYSRPSRDEPQPTDPLKILRASQGLLEPQKRFRRVQIVTPSSARRHFPGVPDHPEDDAAAADLARWPRVLVSPGRLQQVFVNLLINAADAMDGQGTVTVSVETVGAASVRIGFADSGPGIAPDLRRKVFDPFFTTKPPGQGTGLGLAISRSIVESYGGTLEVDPAEHPGAILVVTLPACREGAGEGVRPRGPQAPVS